MKSLATIAAAVLLSGCATPRPPSGTLTAAVAAVRPDLVPYAAQLETILGKSKAAPGAPSSSIPANAEERVVYRYRGAIADKDDFERERSWHIIDRGDAIFDDIPTSPPATAVDADEATAATLAEWLDGLLKGRE